MSNSSINVGHDLNGIANIGDYSNINNKTISNSDNFEFLNEIFESLQERYPDATEAEKLVVAKLEVEKIFNQDSSIKSRCLSALKSGVIEIVKVITNNPFVSVSIETFRGWIEIDT